MKAQYTIQCQNPDTGEVGNWIFKGESHRIKQSAISPIFKDLHALFVWMSENGWKKSCHAPTGCEKEKPTTCGICHGTGIVEEYKETWPCPLCKNKN